MQVTEGKEMKQSTKSDKSDFLKKEEDLSAIRAVLTKDTRGRLLFELAIGTGFQINVLLHLQAFQVSCSDQSVTIELEDNKYEYTNPFLVGALNGYFLEFSPDAQDYLFRKQSSNEPFSLSYASNTIKKWFAAAGLPEYGARSLRKTYEFFNPPNKRKVEPQIPIQKKIFNLLFNEIAQGIIPVGTRLTEAELTKRFAVSSTPIRMAVAQLDVLGFVESASIKQTYVVKGLTQREIWEIWLIRTQLEGLALDLTWENWMPESTKALENIISHWKHAKTMEEKQAYHIKFHKALYRDAQAPILMQFIENLSARISALNANCFDQLHGGTSGEDDGDIKEHSEILHAIQNHNHELARSLLLNSISSGRDMALHNYFRGFSEDR